MSQNFFTNLIFERAKTENLDALRKIDSIIFPAHERSLMDMTSDEADQAIADALEQRLHQGTIPGNLCFFLEEFSGGQFSLKDSILPAKMAILIDEHRDFLKEQIEKYFS